MECKRIEVSRRRIKKEKRGEDIGRGGRKRKNRRRHGGREEARMVKKERTQKKNKDSEENGRRRGYKPEGVEVRYRKQKDERKED